MNTLIFIFSCSMNHHNIFRGLWYHYYQRGLSYMEKEQFDLALKDFQDAIHQRPDRNEDQRMVRTYGTRFIDYFPHREMGVIFSIQGLNEIAEQQLLRSIEHEPTEKAYYYLDRVRMRLFDQQDIKDSLPSIKCAINDVILSENRPYQTNSEILTLTGTIQNNYYISEILLNNENILIDHSCQWLTFQKQYSLPEGLHKIHIIAKNLMGQRNTKTVEIFIDRTGPIIVISQAHQNLPVKGYLQDKSGISSLMINHKPIPVQNTNKAWFTYLPEKTEKKLSLIAKDTLGNQTVAFVRQDLLANMNHPLLLAQNSTDIASGGFNSLVQNCRHIKIELYGLENETIVFSENILIEGVVFNEHNNKMSLSINDTTILRKSEKHIFFNHPVKIQPGKNTILVKAVDNAGHVCTKKINIIRKIPEILKTKYKLPLYFSSFKTFDDKNNDLEETINQLFISKSIEKNRFRVIPSLEISRKEKRNHNALIIEGYCYQTKLGIEIIANVINARTREVICTKDVYIEHKNDIKMNQLINRLVEKIHNEFQEIDGTIVNINEPSYLVKPLSKNTVDLIQLNWPVMFYKVIKMVNSITGSSFGADYVFIGDGYTTEIRRKSFKAISNEKLSLNINDGVKIK